MIASTRLTNLAKTDGTCYKTYSRGQRRLRRVFTEIPEIRLENTAKQDYLTRRFQHANPNADESNSMTRLGTFTTESTTTHGHSTRRPSSRVRRKHEQSDL